MQEISFEEALEQIFQKDSRYRRDAYFFVREALDHTQKEFAKGTRGQPKHVSGQQLLQGIRDLAITQFGPMTVTVFEEWGIRGCAGFGDIVFNLVEVGFLGTTDTDSRADFQDGYDFFEAFRRPFLPSGNQPAPHSEPKATQV